MSTSERHDHTNFDDGELEHEWAGGTIDLADERQTTSLREDPKQRKMMLAGVGGCVVVTLALFGLAARTGSADTVEAPALADDDVHAAELEQPEPAVQEPVEPVLVAKRAGHKPGKRSTAPANVAAGKAAKPGAAATPGAAESADADADAAAGELPDVEQWDEADDAALREQVADTPSPSPSPPTN